MQLIDQDCALAADWFEISLVRWRQIQLQCAVRRDLYQGGEPPRGLLDPLEYQRICALVRGVGGVRR